MAIDLGKKTKGKKVQRDEFEILCSAVLELTKTQKETAKSVKELAHAQRRTDERVGVLAQRVEELAQAQKRTEESLKELSDAVKNLATQVGTLSDSIGFGLEDIARVILPSYLEKHFGIAIHELERRFLAVDGEEIEINLYSEGFKDKEEVVVIGECKSRIYRREVENFENQLKKIEKNLPNKRLIKVMFGYFIHPSGTLLAKERDIILVASYQR